MWEEMEVRQNEALEKFFSVTGIEAKEQLLEGRILL